MMQAMLMLLHHISRPTERFDLAMQILFPASRPYAMPLPVFFASIKSLKHDILVTADTGNVIAAHGYVTYTRHNDTTLRVPVCSVLHMDNGKIKEYFVFIDASQLYNS